MVHSGSNCGVHNSHWICNLKKFWKFSRGEESTIQGKKLVYRNLGSIFLKIFTKNGAKCTISRAPLAINSLPWWLSPCHVFYQKWILAAMYFSPEVHWEDGWLTRTSKCSRKIHCPKPSLLSTAMTTQNWYNGIPWWRRYPDVSITYWFNAVGHPYWPFWHCCTCHMTMSSFRQGSATSRTLWRS
jgi:hypothetical protein